MSDNENQAPSPSKQTSSVPLKKETVRVTLKAADAPAVPSATVPLAPPVRPPVPGGARPPVPAPTIPLKPAGAPTAAPAPTIKLATSAAPLTAGAPTVALKTPGAPTAPAPAPGAPTVPLKPPGGTPTLPKATVQLQPPTAPIGAVSPSQAPTLLVDEEYEEEEPHAGLIKILAGVGLAFALGLLSFQIVLANAWINAEDNARKGDWSLLLEKPPFVR